MDNEEKRQFLVKLHKLYFSYRPYADGLGPDEMRKREDAMWEEFSRILLPSMPQHFYKYRSDSPKDIDSFLRGEVLFRPPCEYADTNDTTVKYNIEKELAELRRNPLRTKIRTIKHGIRIYAKTKNLSIDRRALEKHFPRYDGKNIDPIVWLFYLKKLMPQDAASECLEKIIYVNSEPVYNKLIASLEADLNDWGKTNNILRRKVLAFCLTTTPDSEKMWKDYANDSKGFCIEYSFPRDTFLGQRILLNLSPMIYEKRQGFCFTDMLLRGNVDKNAVNRITQGDYRRLFISSYIKNPIFEPEEEWRVVLDERVAHREESFPYARRIFLGSNMSEENKKVLIDFANGHGIDVVEK